jgi:hypothetical protein
VGNSSQGEGYGPRRIREDMRLAFVQHRGDDLCDTIWSYLVDALECCPFTAGPSSFAILLHDDSVTVLEIRAKHVSMLD